MNLFPEFKVQVLIRVSAGCERTLSLFSIDGDSADRILELQHDDTILSACLSKDSRQLVSGAADQLIRVRSIQLSFNASPNSVREPRRNKTWYFSAGLVGDHRGTVGLLLWFRRFRHLAAVLQRLCCFCIIHQVCNPPVESEIWLQTQTPRPHPCWLRPRCPHQRWQPDLLHPPSEPERGREMEQSNRSELKKRFSLLFQKCGSVKTRTVWNDSLKKTL